MELTVKQKDLARIMATARKVVNKKTTMPVLANARLTAEDGTLTVMASNLEISYEGSCAAEITTPGAVATPAYTLSDFVAKAAAAEVHLKHAPEGSQLLAKAGRTSAKLLTEDPENMPNLPEQDDAPPLEFEAVTLKKALQYLIPATGDESHRGNNLDRVQFVRHESGDGFELGLVAMDGYRLHEVVLLPEGLSEIEIGKGVGISKAGALRLLDFCDDELVHVALSEGLVWVGRGDDQLYLHTVEGGYVTDYRVVLAGKPKASLVIRREALGAVLERIQPFTAHGNAFSLKASNGIMTLLARNIDAGEAEESLEVETDGQIDVSLNAQYLTDAARGLDSDQLEIGVFGFHDSPTPHVLVWGEADQGYKAMIASMRL